MAKPATKPEARATVASCGATDCAHNENRDCTADEVRVSMQDGRATCQTYTPETPKARP